ncbi:MAG: PTS sugar transporter subunit IIA, partial [Erysipelotrichaceae bacterium]|nr:PTS sugar transporter subunit IIA [Erysipelotrichaceae bacterium]
FIAAEKILKKIETIFPNCFFNDFEKYNFYLLIASNSSRLCADHCLFEHIDPSIIELTNTICEKVTDTYGLTLNCPSFKNRFMIHLNNLVFRCKNNTTSKNDLVLITKSQFPLIYEIATYIAYQIKTSTGYQINDEEISFIAFHIGNEIDEQLQKNSLVRCALIAYEYNQIDYHLANKLTSLFGSKIIIVSTDNSNKESYDFNDVDLIITVLPITTKHDFIIVHPLLSLGDIEALEKVIDKIMNNKKNKLMRQSVSSLFKKEFFIKNAKVENESQAITKMCEILRNKNYIEDEFEKSVFEREKLSSTAFGNYAIPHPLVVNSNKTAIFVIVNEKTIKWNNSNVNFIFLLCVSEKDKNIFRDLFSSIIFLLGDSKIKQKLISAESFEDFLAVINNYI